MFNLDYEDVVTEAKDVVDKIVKKDEENEEAMLWLVIPKIDLKEEVYNLSSYLNNVDYHVEVLEESSIEKNRWFFAGHSGSGIASYFNDIDKLVKGDFIYVEYKNERLNFVVEESYFISKTGYFELDCFDEENVLYLITCSLEYADKQLIVKAKKC